MDFKILKLVSLVIGVFMLVSCGDSNDKGAYVIGTPLDKVATGSDSDNVQYVSFFDKTIRKIHIFNLNEMKKEVTYEVKNPKEDHYVVAHKEFTYVIDLSPSNLSIFRKDKEAIHNPITFVGKPISTAFDRFNGYFIVYDDLHSVGMLKLSSDGQVEKSWVGGSIVSGDQGIVSGEIDSNGNLLLALSDGTLSVVSIEQTLDQKTWVYVNQSLGFSDIKWLSVVQGGRVFFQAKDQVVLYSYAAQSVVQSIDTKNLNVSLYSKWNHPHIIYKEEFSSKYHLLFPENTQIRSREVTLANNKRFLDSQLDLANDLWTATKVAPFDGYEWNKNYYINATDKNREVQVYRFSDLLPQVNETLPDKAELKKVGNNIFALYPSSLGYASKINLNTGDESFIELFNLKDIADYNPGKN